MEEKPDSLLASISLTLAMLPSFWCQPWGSFLVCIITFSVVGIAELVKNIFLQQKPEASCIVSNVLLTFFGSLWI